MRPQVTSARLVWDVPDLPRGLQLLDKMLIEGRCSGKRASIGIAPLHVDAAAYAALMAIDHGDPGIYNIAQSNGHVTTEKARVELGWTPDFRLPG